MSWRRRSAPFCTTRAPLDLFACRTSRAGAAARGAFARMFRRRIEAAETNSLLLNCICDRFDISERNRYQQSGEGDGLRSKKSNYFREMGDDRPLRGDRLDGRREVEPRPFAPRARACAEDRREGTDPADAGRGRALARTRQRQTRARSWLSALPLRLPAKTDAVGSGEGRVRLRRMRKGGGRLRRDRPPSLTAESVAGICDCARLQRRYRGFFDDAMAIKATARSFVRSVWARWRLFGRKTTRTRKRRIKQAQIIHGIEERAIWSPCQ